MILEVRDLSVRPTGPTQLTFSTMGGEVIAVRMQDDGASALLRTLAGFLSGTWGGIYLDGRDVSHLSYTRRRPYGVEYAHPQRVRGEGTVERVLYASEIVPRLRRVPPPDVAIDVFEALPRLSDLRSHRVADLDAEEAAVVAVGLALATKPKLLLLDGFARVLPPDAFREVVLAVRTVAAAEQLTAFVADVETAPGLGDAGKDVGFTGAMRGSRRSIDRYFL